ncbi:MAG: right-handed parallel beta-helix repeat-containing protein [Bacteroidetes bacterium]|nr:right-handed parallel beta-helix repeat-containing protein [Bacteroidota bacterium]
MNDAEGSIAIDRHPAPAGNQPARLSLSFIVALVMLPAILAAQPTFDIGDSELAIWANAGSQTPVLFTVKNLIFDADLMSTHRYKGVDGGQIPTGNTWGYEGPWSFDAATGDIDLVRDTLGCSDYEIQVAGVTFRLNLIDANWGAGSTTSVYRLLIEAHGQGVRFWVREPGSTGNWSATSIAISNGGSYSYWELVQAAFPNDGYVRERTTFNNKRFHVTGTDDQLPLPSTQVVNAKLDVDLDVHVDACVPYGRSLLIEGFDETGYGTSATTLRFDDATGLTVYGSLRTVETQYQNEYIYFTSSSADPAPGDWDGIHGDAPSYLYLNRCSVFYAAIGLHIEDCYTVEGYDIKVAHSLYDGLRISGSSGLFDDLTASQNAGDNLDIESSDLSVYNSHFTQSGYGNGVLVGANSAVLLSDCDIYYNRQCGVVAYADVNLTIDSCDIYDNGTVPGEYWMGVYAYFNGIPTVIRHSRIHGQYQGIRATGSSMFGYERHSDPVTWDNPDSLGRNCVYWNEYNLFGYEALYEFAKTYYDRSVPHYQGGENSIFDPGSLQGDFELSTAFLHRNWWNGNHIFNVNNSTVTTWDELPSDSAGCPVENFRSSQSPITASWNPQAASLYSSWYTLTADSLKTLLYGQRVSLSALDALTGFERVWRIADTATVEAWFKQVVAHSSRPEVLRPAYRYIAAARQRAGDYSGATQAWLATVGYAVYGGTGYIASQAMAAIAMHLGGSQGSARASVDTLLKQYPDSPEVLMADWIVGNASTPRRRALREVALPARGWELNAPWPNPAAGMAMISFTLPESAEVDVTVHDVLGRMLRRIAAGTYPAGTTSVRLHAAELPAGLYLLRMTSGGETRTRTLRIVR